jgi:uncharacterized protein YbcI
MRVAYRDNVKIYPKKYSKIKDIQHFFDWMWVSSRLSKTERERLDAELDRINLDLFYKALAIVIKGFDKPVKELIGASTMDSIVKINRRTEPSYTVVRFANKVECRIDDSWYRLAKKTKGIKTEMLNRGY